MQTINIGINTIPRMLKVQLAILNMAPIIVAQPIVAKSINTANAVLNIILNFCIFPTNI